MKKYAKKIVYTLLFFTTVLLSTACPDKGDIDAPITVYNKSNNDLFVLACISDYIEDCDGTLPKDKGGIKVEKGKCEVYNLIRFNKKMYFFILSMDVVNIYSWDEIRKTNNYLKRYEFDGTTELDRINWTITYP